MQQVNLAIIIQAAYLYKIYCSSSSVQRTHGNQVDTFSILTATIHLIVMMIGPICHLKYWTICQDLTAKGT